MGGLYVEVVRDIKRRLIISHAQTYTHTPQNAHWKLFSAQDMCAYLIANCFTAKAHATV